MSDSEWQQWQETFQRKEGVMPEIVQRVRRAKLLLVGSHLVFAAIAVFELAMGLHNVLHGGEPRLRLMGASIIAFISVMATLYVAAVAGLWKRERATPEALLGWMERTFEASDRAGQVARWGGVVACTLTALFVGDAHLRGRGSAVDLAIAALVIGLTFAFTWTMPLFVRRRLAKKRAQVEAWRKALGEGEPGRG